MGPSAMALALSLATLAQAETEFVVGKVRVQALSPRLLRIEPQGPRGFEDRSTFTVQSREFQGVAMNKTSSGQGVWLNSSFYSVLVDSKVRVFTPQGQIFDSASEAGNLLHWPSPLKATSYALMDYPRFFVPDWGTVPIPEGAKVDPDLLATNGYDFRNNIRGDTYIFLLGQDLSAWSSARVEFLKLTGPCPLLPDFAYGTWFTYWHSYTEAEAKDDIEHWERLKLPIDVWALDMNWRNTSDNQDWYYDHPNTALFPNFTEWFEYLRARRLRTYFNDHPYPVASRNAGGLQTSPEETKFRWQGLSEWMAKGMTYWWFDHNWKFSIPPPFVNQSTTDGVWQGLDNAAWGSHIYYSAVEYYDRHVRDKAGDTFYGRPMTLTKFGKPDWKPGMDPQEAAEHPAQHRFPVWWTGDGVDLQASTESMVDAGLHGLKPFVHSDCGGDGRQSAGDLMRWTAHCVFGSILRFHGADHRPWSYDNHTLQVISSYLGMRYKMLPMLLSAGQKATKTGFPLVARGDFFWPEHPESASNQQYVFLEDILVAPIWNSGSNITSRQVWIPPGHWKDSWDGSITEGPKTVTATQPWERQPMWIRPGAMLVLTDEVPKRVEDVDWSRLTLEVYPAETRRQKVLHEPNGEETQLQMQLENGHFHLSIESKVARRWRLRVHLQPGQKMSQIFLGGRAVPAKSSAGSSLLSAPGTVVELELQGSTQHLKAVISSEETLIGLVI
ncbi:unnamed protein product [Effrenium voratum]|uniref:Uncharacterized protein n=1 Tax=Effrenium voratum TaxID=2562239 RepID=A0AA36J9A0_9DINO|nr:unnamed protein product [Effrenium voratum]CAJ1444718.1 unnamed protein product [Effrenium voratum]